MNITDKEFSIESDNLRDVILIILLPSIFICFCLLPLQINYGTGIYTSVVGGMCSLIAFLAVRFHYNTISVESFTITFKKLFAPAKEISLTEIAYIQLAYSTRPKGNPDGFYIKLKTGKKYFVAVDHTFFKKIKHHFTNVNIEVRDPL